MEWTDIIWAGVSGAVGGAASGAAEWFLRRRVGDRLSPRVRHGLAVACCLLAFAAVRNYPGRYEVLEQFYPLLPERVAFKLRAERYGRRLMAGPAIEPMLKAAPSKAAALETTRQ